MYDQMHATYAPIPQKYKHTLKKTVGASSKMHAAPTMIPATAKRSTYTPTHLTSKKKFGQRAHHQTKYVTGAPRTYTHKTHSTVATIPATIPTQTAALPAYPGFHPTYPTAPLADANIYAPAYTAAPIDYTHQTYQYATPLPYPAEPVYTAPLYEGAALPVSHTAYEYPEEPITGTAAPIDYTHQTYQYATPLPYP